MRLIYALRDWLSLATMLIGAIGVLGFAVVRVTEGIIHTLKFHDAVIDFFWHRKRFHEWRKAGKAKS